MAKLLSSVTPLQTSAMAAPDGSTSFIIPQVYSLLLNIILMSVRHEMNQKTEAVLATVSLLLHPTFLPFILNQSLGAPAVFGARFPGFFSCSPVNLHHVLRPRGHAALVHSAAAGQAGHLAGREDSVPQAHLGQLSHQGLGRVEASTQRILGNEEKKVRLKKHTHMTQKQSCSP